MLNDHHEIFHVNQGCTNVMHHRIEKLAREMLPDSVRCSLVNADKIHSSPSNAVVHIGESHHFIDAQPGHRIDIILSPQKYPLIQRQAQNFFDAVKKVLSGDET